MSSLKYHLLIICLLASASVAAGYLFFSGMSEASPVGCSAGASCYEVINSSWSSVLGVSVLIPGVSLYLLLVACTLFAGKQVLLQRVGLLVSWLIILAAVWFGVVQIFILKAFCPWCCTIHLLAAAGGAVNLWIHRAAGNRVLRSAFAPAIGCMVFFVLVQCFFPSPVSGYRANDVTALEFAASANQISLYGGDLMIKRADLPTIVRGDTAAACILLSDYSCPHCLEFHQSLVEKASSIAPVASVYFLPAYQSPQSRELNRIMLILQRVDFKIYKEVIDGMVSGEIPLNYRQLRTLADEKLEGNYETYFKTYGSWAQKMLESGKTLMELNQVHSQAAVFPQTIIGGKLIEGVIPVRDFIQQIKINAGSASKMIKRRMPAEKRSEASNLVFAQGEFNLGRITKGKVGIGVIKIMNQGAKDAVISKVGRTCGCIDIEMDGFTVSAGAEKTLPFKFSTKKFLGDVTHSVLFFEQDVRRAVRIPINLEVWLPVKIFPLKNFLGQVAVGGASRVRKVSLITEGEDAVHLSLGDIGHEAISAELETIREGRHYELKLEVKEMPDSQIDSFVTINTDHPDCEQVNLPVIASPGKVIDYSPRQLHSISLAQRRQVRVRVACNDEGFREKFQVTSVQYVGDPAVKLSRKVDKDSKLVTITMIWAKDADLSPEKRKEDYLKIETNQPDFRVIQIPYIQDTKAPDE
ncbi:MAG: vitamin K epoxide reductase family protein [Akkermansiaceae bacterium]